MNILISGATAYAGHHAALAFRRAGHSVFGLVRDAGKPRALELLQNEIHLVECDLTRPDTFRDALRACDVMLHAAMDKENPVETDEKLFAALEEVSREESVPARHRLFIYTTGCSIYGKVPEHIMDENTPGNPEHALAFRMELERKLFALDAPNLRRVVARPGFMYGLDGATSVSAQWFEMGAKGRWDEPVLYRGDRDKGWSWIHIEDLSDAYLRIAESTLDGEVFCLADENRPKCVDVMRACLNAAGYDGPIEFGPPDDADPTSTWFDQNEFITSQKARRVLGWTPKHTGILDDIETYHAAWKASQMSSES